MSSCNEYLELIGQKLDGCLTPDEEARLDAHLRQCPRCRAALEAYSWIDQGVKELTEEPPADLHGRIMDAVAKEPRQAETTPAEDPHSGIHALPEKKRRFIFGPGTAMAAVAAILVLLVGTGKIRLPMNGKTNAASSSAVEYSAEEAAEEALDGASSDTAAAEFSAGMEESAAEEAVEEAVEEVVEEAAEEELADEAAEEPVTSSDTAATESGSSASVDTDANTLTETLTFGHEISSGLCFDTIYHSEAGQSTEILFPEDVDTTQVTWSLNNPDVAYVEDNRIYSRTAGAAVIVVRYGDCCEVLTLLAETDESAYSDCLADFWSSGFDLTVEDADLSQDEIADTFLYQEYEEMEAAVYSTDWEANVWRYDNVTVLGASASGDRITFCADWTCTFTEDSIWVEQPLWVGDDVVHQDASEPYATKTVYYIMQYDAEKGWYLVWKGDSDSEVDAELYNDLLVETDLTWEQLDELSTMILELDGNSEETVTDGNVYYFEINSDVEPVLEWLTAEGLEYSYTKDWSVERTLIVVTVSDDAVSETASATESAAE